MTAFGGSRGLVRRVVALGCATTLAGASAALLLATPAQADDEQTNDNRYSLNAEGDGMYFTLYDGSLPATPNVDTSPYSAQSSINSQGASSGFAGLPYAGKTAETLPGTINGLSGGNFPPVPAFPGYVATTYPGHKTERQSQGPYLVASDSQQYSSHASAGNGVSGDNGTNHQQVFSVSDVTALGDGTTVAHATAGVDGLSFGPIDALNVSSDLKMTSDGKGKPKVVETDNLGSFTVLGFKIGITKDGFVVLGANLPLPTKTILNNINTQLGAQGLQIEVIPGKTTEDKATGATTVTSGSVKITNVRDIRTQGPTTVTYTLARATVSTVNVAAVSFDNGSTGGTTGGGTTGGTTGGNVVGSTGGGSGGIASDPSTGGLVAPGSTGSVDVPPPLVDGSTGGLPSSSGTVTAQPPTRTLGFLPANNVKGTETRSLYLVLVLAGLGVLGGQQLFRFIGIRLMLRTA